MKRSISALAAGLLFAVGLAIAGMTQPSRVVGFLDFFGDWDPSLAFVMAGAIAVHLVFYRLVRRRPSPIFGDAFRVPTRRDVTPQLIAGSALFGLGWGLGGFCPGPGVTSLATHTPEAITFVAAMTAGMFGFEAVERLRTRRREKKEQRRAELARVRSL